MHSSVSYTKDGSPEAKAAMWDLIAVDNAVNESLRVVEDSNQHLSLRLGEETEPLARLVGMCNRL